MKRGGKVLTMALLEDEGQLPVDAARPAARMHLDALLVQLDEKLRSAPETISERDRALFWLYYLQGYTAEEIARLSGAGLTAKGVESAIRRVTAWLSARVGRKSPAAAQAESG
jgi:RNA polymerase sigma-70 factor (ECF subfamily)